MPQMLSSRAELQQHYDAMWQQARAKFALQQFDTDPYLQGKADYRYGITLLARPSTKVKQQILQQLVPLQQLDPRQYLYPASDIHLTVLSLISCVAGFRLAEIQPEPYIALIRQALADSGPLQLKFSGITASASSVLVQGFFADAGLNQLRERLRQLFGQSGLRHSIDQRYPLQTAHLTVLRFSQSPAQPGPLLKHLDALRHCDFGQCTIDELELVGNDWYQRQQNTVLLQRLALG
ncbi:2'-5' RNA ligase family protein [Rheinheimera marina]|uniref:2'-5' RNA ligase family protein n=1 Tax=Rheinheimera marina TaxID=1774958 RepID=A0ABV9JL65_9GAMM